ncbi:MAG TPA: PAS domain S-box protein [Aquabacterium sp.]|nr:PAS domain S-box protein [Aquabacterium sp.]
MTPAVHVDDAWFDLVPLALLEFNEHGKVLRSNAALARLLGYSVASGAKLAHTTPAVQRLCGWDSPLTLLALGPEDSPLNGQATIPKAPGSGAGKLLNSQVWNQAQADPSRPKRYLCVIQEATGSSAPSSIQTGAAKNLSQDQLLHELSTILDSTPAGIAYMRGDVLLRCNRRFERMLGLTPGTTPGQRIDVLLARDPRINRVMTQSTAELRSGGQYETELEIVMPGQNPRWYGLSLRRIGDSVAQMEVIAVLSDITRIRAQQAQLQALGRDRDLMFSLSGVGIAFVRDGIIQSANPALSHLVGDDSGSLVGRNLMGLYATEVDSNSEPDVMSVLRSLGHWQGERALRHRRGTALWTEVALRLVNPQKPEEGFIASFVNVDDRHRAELNLTLQADRTRAILDSVFVGIVTLDSEGIAWMNRSARRMFAGDLADFVGHPLSTVATPDIDHPFRMTDYLDHLQDGQTHTFECQVVGRDGRVFWVVGNAVVTLGEHNQRQITYALLDIDRRRQAEAQTAEAQATLQRIIEMAPMAIMLIDAKSLKVLQVNQTAASFMHMDVSRVPGMTPEDLFDENRARAIRADMLNSLDSGAPLHREYNVQGKATNQIWDVNFLPLHKEGQPVDQLLMVATDVTEQRKAEQARLDAAIAQREMLVKEVHHRIKNNLQGVAGLLQQIAARKPEVASAISEVVGQVQAIAQVYGLQVGAGGPLRLKNVIEAISNSVQRTFGRPITLTFDGEHGGEWLLPEAESIPIALSLNELLTNAHKHGDPSTPLVCHVQSIDDAQVCIDIRNKGQLPEGFNLARVPGGVSGLGLVRALLPRRSSKLNLTQENELVLTHVELSPPGIHLAPTPHVSGAASGHQIALWPQ